MILSLINTIVLAADTVVVEEFDTGANLLEDIVIPVFIDFGPLQPGSATVFSFLSAIGIFATIAIVIFWIYRILIIGIEAFKSEGKPEALQAVFKKLQNILLGVFLSLLFPVILSIIGIFAGIGTVFEWPRMFRSCDYPDYDYYYQAYLDQEGSNATEQADKLCGYASPNGAGSSRL